MIHSLLRSLKSFTSEKKPKLSSVPWKSFMEKHNKKMDESINPIVRKTINRTAKACIIDARHKLMKDSYNGFFLSKCLESGVAKISTNAMESWNFEDKSKVEGQWDRDGFGSIDIVVTIQLDFTKLKDLIWYGKRLVQFAKELPEDISEFGLIEGVKFWWGLKPTRKWSKWVFVLDSKEMSKSDLADIIVDRAAWPKASHELKGYIKLHTQASDELSDDDVNLHLDSTSERIGENLWISSTDPTCMTFDEKKFWFDKKDGWSMKAVGLLLEVWFDHMFTKKVKVEVDNESN
jgi:hypothetical protein